MTFEERCKRFEKNTENEINLFKKVCRVIFLDEKKEEQAELERQLFADMLQNSAKEVKTKKSK